VSDRIRRLLLAAHTLFGRRGVKRRAELSSSIRRSVLSIQPKQSASSTASASESDLRSRGLFRNRSHTPVERA
jgi:hypothetical protein